MKVEGLQQPLPVDPVKPDYRNSAGPVVKKQAKVEDKGQDQQKEGKMDLKQVKKAVELLNKTMESYNTELRFTMHEKSGEYMIKIINTMDNSVIREIPPRKVLDMVAYFKELLGFIVDKFI